MSITSCLVFLLCLSLHACNARPLPATDNKKNLDKNFHISNQNDEKKVSVAEKVESLSSNELGVAKEHKPVETTHILEDGNQKLKDAKKKRNIGRKTGSFQKESLVSVPWRVPHNKHGEKHPGFNLDYSPPKTHPPSHN